MELSPSSLLVCLIATAFLFLLLNRSRFTKLKPSMPQVPHGTSDQAASVDINPNPCVSQPPPQTSQSPPPSTPTGWPREEVYQTIHPQLLWIPFPSLHPPPASTCGRKGSVAIPWQEDLPCEDATGQLECRRNSDLLSGVGEQFTNSLGRRRLSWLVWEDGAVDDGKGRSACGC
ncbi:hypothetical protein GE09DRAFT_1062813 [Coniochaeta sp. 2T2.1]|nr:hypothetical protein GE09DRAFT_1062813 [Coniochaeta sp. 2T2.1]